MAGFPSSLFRLLSSVFCLPSSLVILPKYGSLPRQASFDFLTIKTQLVPYHQNLTMFRKMMLRNIP
jgi:hypothetical protein